MIAAALRIGLLLAAGVLAPARAATGPCGNPTDWCPTPPGASCGRHRTEAACRADPGCAGLPYRGESVVGLVSASSRSDANPSAPFAAPWEQVAGSAGWHMLVSPAFPEHWPPLGGGALVRYAFAYRLPLHVADGAETAAPWARSVGKPGGAVRVELLRRRLDPIGIQGVRPMGAGEAELAGRQEEVAVLLLSPRLDPAAESLVRAFYCNWLGRQGVVAAAIMPRHPEFHRWLSCR